MQSSGDGEYLSPLLLYHRMYYGTTSGAHGKLHAILRTLPSLLMLTSWPAIAGENNPDFSNLIGKAQEIGVIDARLQALSKSADSLTIGAVRTALEEVRDVKSLRERVVLTGAIYKRWGALAPAEAFSSAAALPEGSTKFEILRCVLPAFAEKNIVAASASVERMAATRSRRDASLIIADVWARKDVKAALSWVESLPQSFPKVAARRCIYFIAVRKDPAAMSGIVRDMQPSETKTALIYNVAGGWAMHDPRKAIAWAESLSTWSDKETALATAIESWADVEPVAAADFALALSPPSLRDRAVGAALERWATQDPEAAMLWTLAGEERLRGSGLTRVLSVFAQVCPDTAAEWVARLPPGKVRDESIVGYVEAVLTWDPAQGCRLAAEISDPEVKSQQIQRCFEEWAAFDAESATTWIEQVGFREKIETLRLKTPLSH